MNVGVLCLVVGYFGIGGKNVEIGGGGGGSVEVWWKKESWLLTGSSGYYIVFGWWSRQHGRRSVGPHDVRSVH